MVDVQIHYRNLVSLNIYAVVVLGFTCSTCISHAEINMLPQ